VSLKIDVGL